MTMFGILTGDIYYGIDIYWHFTRNSVLIKDIARADKFRPIYIFASHPR